MKNGRTCSSISALLCIQLSILLALPSWAQTIPANSNTKSKNGLHEKMLHQRSAAEAIQNEDYQKSQDELNQVYNRILHDYASDTLFIKKLKVAQQAWLNYRDAYIESRFPAEDKLGTYGTVYRLCYSMNVQAFNEQRTKELKQWLDGAEVGDSCAGSIHRKYIKAN